VKLLLWLGFLILARRQCTNIGALAAVFSHTRKSTQPNTLRVSHINPLLKTRATHSQCSAIEPVQKLSLLPNTLHKIISFG
jgi:hypothetical protein